MLMNVLINWGVMRISSDLRKQISPQEHFRRVSGIPCTNQALTRCIWLNFQRVATFISPRPMGSRAKTHGFSVLWVMRTNWKQFQVLRYLDQPQVHTYGRYQALIAIDRMPIQMPE